MDFEFLKKLIIPANTRIVLLIMDGLGGLPREPGGKTELEAAHTPNLDALAAQSSLGLTIPVAPGITPGSGPGHLAIFGYDPLLYEIGRGALEALGVNFELGPDDLAARGNFCTLDADGLIADRRAGRIKTEITRELIKNLNTIKIEGVEVTTRTIKEHRFAFVMNGANLDDRLTEMDPQKTGVAPNPAKPLRKEAERTAALVNEYAEKARSLLADKLPANAIMLRGFAKCPLLPTYSEIFGLNAAAIAINGMYKGVAHLAGMQVLPVEGITLDAEFSALEKYWNDFDFFYLHVKQTDSAGEDGGFDLKVQIIEQVDALIPRLMALNPDVVIVGGDHSSPAILKTHSWHPVPTLLYSKLVRPDGITEFGERACLKGSLGILPAKDIMPIALANAGRITKWSA
ncbi:MAG: 2,3-bisphosphoglycerate-independent phosphoglycerate mutase [Anaerolineaceae bacterium]